MFSSCFLLLLLNFLKHFVCFIRLIFSSAALGPWNLLDSISIRIEHQRSVHLFSDYIHMYIHSSAAEMEQEKVEFKWRPIRHSTPLQQQPQQQSPPGFFFFQLSLLYLLSPSCTDTLSSLLLISSLHHRSRSKWSMTTTTCCCASWHFFFF